MQAQELIINIFERISQELDRALMGLTQEDVNKQPSHDTNSIGWLMWHLTRYQDTTIKGLLGEEQLWVNDKWYIKFSRDAAPQDSGIGHTPKDVATFQSPDIQALLDYHHAVVEETKRYVSGLSEVKLEKKIDNPKWPTIGKRLEGLINDNYQHLGQIAYVRGLLKGQGWREASLGIPKPKA
ncbi:DinB family protein [Chloroflexota bacterium]